MKFKKMKTNKKMDYKKIVTPERFRSKQLELYNKLGCDLSKMPVKKIQVGLLTMMEKYCVL